MTLTIETTSEKTGGREVHSFKDVHTVELITCAFSRDIVGFKVDGVRHMFGTKVHSFKIVDNYENVDVLPPQQVTILCHRTDRDEFYFASEPVVDKSHGIVEVMIRYKQYLTLWFRTEQEADALLRPSVNRGTDFKISRQVFAIKRARARFSIDEWNTDTIVFQ